MILQGRNCVGNRGQRGQGKILWKSIDPFRIARPSFDEAMPVAA